MIEWIAKSFSELTQQELYEILSLRQRVFVVEQRCLYLDVDGRDQHSSHLCGWDEQHRLRAYLRIVAPGKRYAEPSIGRVVTDPSARGLGLGREVMRRGIEWCNELHPGLPIRIEAQQYLERFYCELGFVADPAKRPYDDEGIMHVEMVRPPGT